MEHGEWCVVVRKREYNLFVAVSQFNGNRVCAGECSMLDVRIVSEDLKLSNLITLIYTRFYIDGMRTKLNRTGQI